MPISKHTKNTAGAKKAVAAGALVALSGFVPQPFVQTARIINSAQAASQEFSAKATFASGITLSKKAEMNFGTVVATDVNGKFTLKTDGGVTASNGVGIANKAVGVLGVKALTTGGNIDLTLAGLGLMDRAATANGGDQGTVKLASVIFKDKLGAADLTFKSGGGTVAKVADYDFNKKTASNIAFGGALTWTARPIGVFTTTLTLSANF